MEVIFFSEKNEANSTLPNIVSLCIYVRKCNHFRAHPIYSQYTGEG